MTTTITVKTSGIPEAVAFAEFLDSRGYGDKLWDLKGVTRWLESPHDRRGVRFVFTGADGPHTYFVSTGYVPHDAMTPQEFMDNCMAYNEC